MTKAELEQAQQRHGASNGTKHKLAAAERVDPHRLPTMPSPPPMAPPPFTVAQLRAAIPAHCFERSALRSFAYLFADLAGILILGVLANKFLDTPGALPAWLQSALWPVYWYAQGCVMTGVWVVAHECGHQAFSASRTLNNAVGLVCHSAVLVPYHSWRITHGNHHKNTNSMENDEVFVPATRSEVPGMSSDTPLVNLFGIFNMLLLGWPLYLTLNVAGPAKYRGKPNSHFNPHAALFKPRQAMDVVVSDIGLFVALAAVGYACYTLGVSTVAFYYFVPYLVVNCHLVLITYLQHTATYVPHYRDEEFTWLRGALCTVDRSFGSVLNALFHHISDTHVAHHLFHTMPHYHAQEATKYLERVLGPYYLRDDTPIPVALYHSWSHCRFVEDDGAVLAWKKE